MGRVVGWPPCCWWRWWPLLQTATPTATRVSLTPPCVRNLTLNWSVWAAVRTAQGPSGGQVSMKTEP
ncbi:hypothetical protein Hamer_G029893 [Homarus americanus]|uniref:Secreted protein n=1 Tax=Homarus americanus TaxID=6706 RepID=A0A8J5MUG7_HOMAM|nr:hypothetical protein Hamer_G029893 [Homarus americanus]